VGTIAALITGVIRHRQRKPMWAAASVCALLGVLSAIGFEIETTERRADEARAAAAQREAAAKAAAKAREAAELAAKKKELLNDFDGLVDRLTERYAADANALKSAPLGATEKVVHQFERDVGGFMKLAKAEKREDLAIQLQEVGLQGLQALQDGRAESIAKEIADTDRLYDAHEFEAARARLYALQQELAGAAGDGSMPQSYRDWAKKHDAKASARLTRAVRAKEFPDIQAYFGQWPSKRSDLEQRAKRLTTQTEYQILIVDLALPLLYARYVDEMTTPEYSMLPAKVRSKAFLRAVRSELGRVEKQADRRLQYMLSCGNQPTLSGWDGGNSEAESLVKQTAHDPDSIDVEHCTVPELTSARCWRFTCNVRGKNMFGALVLNEKTFYQDATTIRSY
jgi:hypothetical protein